MESYFRRKEGDGLHFDLTHTSVTGERLLVSLLQRVIRTARDLRDEHSAVYISMASEPAFSKGGDFAVPGAIDKKDESCPHSMLRVGRSCTCELHLPS